jgi:signal transduction histidine kinase
MSLVQSVAFLLYGLGIVLSALQSDPGGARAWTRWAPLLAPMVGTLAGILFWQALRMSELQQSLAHTDAAAHSVAGELESTIASAASILQMLAWKSLNPDWRLGDEWVADAELAMAGYAGFEAVELIGEDLGSRRVTSNKSARRPVVEAGSVDSTLSEQLVNVRRDHRAVAVLPFRFADEAPGLRVVVRIGSQADERGYITGVLDAEAVVGEAADRSVAAYVLELSCGGQLMFPRDAADAEVSNSEWRREISLRLPGPTVCQLATTPRRGFLAAQDSGLAELALGASLAISVLLGLTLRFAALASTRAAGLEDEVKARTSDLRDAMVSLRSENEQRRRSEATLERALEMTILVSGERDIESVVQSVTDAATELSGAAWGAFFYHPLTAGETGMRYTVSGVSRDAFAGLQVPRATPLIGPALRGEELIRLHDVTADPRYGQNPPFHGLAPGHPLAVVSFMAVPVRSRAGNVWGAILLGHPVAGVFTERDEDIAIGMAAEASIALDHARAHAIETELKVEAQAANAAKDRFLATLSHELRNPLGSLRTSLDVLERNEATAEGRARMERIARRQVDHLTRMVNDLLDVARIGGGKLAVSLRRVDLVRLVREAVDADAQHIHDHELNLHLDLDQKPTWVDADPTRIAQIMGNLLGNAIKFTPSRGKITVSVAADYDADQAVLYVADTGAGIAEAELERVFDPFVQGDQQIDREEGGLGLGLAVVKGLADAHGGTIEAHSDGIGQGTTLVLRLPLKEPPPERPARPTRRSSTAALTVLIIDDHRDSIEGLTMLLEQCGHTVFTAYDGREGLEIAKAEHPDLVICDLGLPTMDGYEVARALRADRSTVDMTLFALTGYGDPDATRRASEAGFDRHLIKPVDPEALLELIALVGTH